MNKFKVLLCVLGILCYAAPSQSQTSQIDGNSYAFQFSGLTSSVPKSGFGLYFNQNNPAPAQYEFHDGSGNVMFSIGASNGKLTTVGNLFVGGDINPGGALQIDPNEYAFQYTGNQNFGLRFNANDAQYEFMDGSANSIAHFNGINGDAFIKGQTRLGIDSAITDEDFTLHTGDQQWGFLHTNGDVSLGTWLFSELDTTPQGVGAGQIGTFSDHRLDFITNNGPPQVSLLQSGQLGVGTITPQTKLDVDGDVAIRYLPQNNALNEVVVADTNGVLHVRDASSLGGNWTLNGNDIYNTNLGFVGIGTTVPTNNLDVLIGENSGGGNLDGFIVIRDPDDMIARIGDGSSTDESGYLHLYQDGTEKIRLGFYSITNGVGGTLLHLDGDNPKVLFSDPNDTRLSTIGAVGGRMDYTVPSTYRNHRFWFGNEVRVNFWGGSGSNQGVAQFIKTPIDIELHEDGAGGLLVEDPNNQIAYIGDGSSTNENGILQLWDQTGTETIRLFATPGLPSWIDAGNVGIGTSTPQSKLAVNGTITCKEVDVTLTGFPDYVFCDDYDLMPLSELSEFIDANGHLPNIPSEAEVLKEGIGLAELNVKLVEKVEELTLYVLEQEERMKKMEAELATLKTK